MDEPRLHPLRAYREAHEPPLSQEQLAKILGVDRVTVTRWEGGQRLIERDKVRLVSERTGIAPELLRPDWAEALGVSPPITPNEDENAEARQQ